MIFLVYPPISSITRASIRERLTQLKLQGLLSKSYRTLRPADRPEMRQRLQFLRSIRSKKSTRVHPRWSKLEPANKPAATSSKVTRVDYSRHCLPPPDLKSAGDFLPNTPFAKFPIQEYSQPNDPLPTPLLPETSGRSYQD